MANQRIPNISVENARIIFRNFAGKESKFNAKGKRNFCLVLDNDVAEDLKDIGWNIKYLSPRDPDDVPQAYLQVAVAFDNFPPKIWRFFDRVFRICDEAATLVEEFPEDYIRYVIRCILVWDACFNDRVVCTNKQDNKSCSHDAARQVLQSSECFLHHTHTGRHRC